MGAARGRLAGPAAPARGSAGRAFISAHRFGGHALPMYRTTSGAAPAVHATPPPPRALGPAAAAAGSRRLEGERSRRRGQAMLRIALALAGLLVLLPVAVLAAGLGGEQALPSAAALADIPAAYLALYEQAALRFGLPWELLAAVGKVESDHGRAPGTYVPNAAGAEGPMQFEPATFAAYSWASGSPAPSIDDPHDAIEAAAAMLAANGAPDDTARALYAYNHAGWYVSEVLGWAATYSAATYNAAAARRRSPRPGRPARRSPSRSRSSGRPTSGAATERAASTARGSCRPPTSPPGSVCRAPPRRSTRPARRSARAPRSKPGDLVFFGSGPDDVTHVGILVSGSEMVDAPHSGAEVRLEPFDWPDYLGATRPAI